MRPQSSATPSVWRRRRTHLSLAWRAPAALRMTDVERFPFSFADAYRWPARLFGVTSASAWVDVDPDTLVARFGRWRVVTPLANITAVAVTGPYAFLKTAGPARLAITDGGLTFATNNARGVLISFREPVPGLEPTGLLRHPELTVTVDDVDGLARRLRPQARAS